MSGSKPSPNNQASSNDVAPEPRDDTARNIGIAVVILGVVGAGVASLPTNAISGATTNWIGAAIAAGAVALGLALHASRNVRIAAIVLFALAAISAGFTEHKVQQVRAEVSEIFSDSSEVFSDSSSAYTPATTTTPPKPKTANIGEIVTNGDLQFRVHDVRRQARVSSQFDTSYGQEGYEYVIVQLQVRNGSNAPVFFYETSQLLVVDGRQIEPELQASSALNSNSSGEIQPSMTIQLELPFFVPAGTQPDAILLQDFLASMGSNDPAARVNLRPAA